MTKEFEQILIDLISEKEGLQWHTLAIKKIGYEILKEHFSNSKDRYDKFFNTIESRQDKLEKFNKVVRFYYFLCKRPSISKVLAPDFKLIVIFSIMEYLMSEEKFVPFDQWLQSEMSKDRVNITTQNELEAVLRDYYDVHGSRTKVSSFFNMHCTKEDMESLMYALQYLDNDSNAYKNINNIKELISFVEGIRSLFIHRATHIQISSIKDYKEQTDEHTRVSGALLTEVKNKRYIIDTSTMHIEGLQNCFEKGIINYFSN